MSYTGDETTDITVDREWVLQIIREHGIDDLEFLDDMGSKEEYEGSEVLGWLGY